eukprot:g7773.t1
MEALGYSNQYILAWQSKVGPLPWITPKTGEVLQNYGKRGHKDVLVVPVAFTCDHVETLYEIDIEYRKEAEEIDIEYRKEAEEIDIEYRKEAEEAGITNFFRAPSLNGSELLTQAQAELVAAHLQRNVATESRQFDLRCH